MEIKVRGYGKSYQAGFNECNEMWKKKIQEMIAESERKRDKAELTITSALFQRDINTLLELLGDEK